MIEGYLKSFVLISTLSMMIQLCKEIKVKLDKSRKSWYLTLRVFWWLLLLKFFFLWGLLARPSANMPWTSNPSSSLTPIPFFKQMRWELQTK